MAEKIKSLCLYRPTNQGIGATGLAQIMRTALRWLIFALYFVFGILILEMAIENAYFSVNADVAGSAIRMMKVEIYLLISIIYFSIGILFFIVLRDERKQPDKSVDKFSH